MYRDFLCRKGFVIFYKPLAFIFLCLYFVKNQLEKLEAAKVA